MSTEGNTLQFIAQSLGLSSTHGWTIVDYDNNLIMVRHLDPASGAVDISQVGWLNGIVLEKNTAKVIAGNYEYAPEMVADYISTDHLDTMTITTITGSFRIPMAEARFRVGHYGQVVRLYSYQGRRYISTDTALQAPASIQSLFNGADISLEEGTVHLFSVAQPNSTLLASNVPLVTYLGTLVDNQPVDEANPNLISMEEANNILLFGTRNTLDTLTLPFDSRLGKGGYVFVDWYAQDRETRWDNLYHNETDQGDSHAPRNRPVTFRILSPAYRWRAHVLGHAVDSILQAPSQEAALQYRWFQLTNEVTSSRGGTSSEAAFIQLVHLWKRKYPIFNLTSPSTEGSAQDLNNKEKQLQNLHLSFLAALPEYWRQVAESYLQLFYQVRGSVIQFLLEVIRGQRVLVPTEFTLEERRLIDIAQLAKKNAIADLLAGKQPDPAEAYLTRIVEQELGENLYRMGIYISQRSE